MLPYGMKRSLRPSAMPQLGLQTRHLPVLLEDTWVAALEGFAMEPLIVQSLSASAGNPTQIAHRVHAATMVAAIIAGTCAVGLPPRYTELFPYFREHVVLRPIEGLDSGRHLALLTWPQAQTRERTRTVIDRFAKIAEKTRHFGRKNIAISRSLTRFHPRAMHTSERGIRTSHAPTAKQHFPSAWV